MRPLEDFVARDFARVGWNWKAFEFVDPKLNRRPEVDLVQAGAAFANSELHWQSQV